MPKITLNNFPDELDLFCPFCGEHILASCSEEPSSLCGHTICVGDGENKDNIIDSDVVFVVHEPAPSNEEYTFAFREP